MATSISVVIPAYNREGTIKKCLDSIKKQTRPVDEVIVVDDCSTDGTLKVLEDYSGLNLKIISLEKNSGAQVARNTGAMAAGSEWIAFLDSDDEWAPDKTRLQLEMLEGGDYDAVFSPGIKRENGKESIAWTWSQEKSLYEDLVSGDAYVMFQSLVISKEAFERIGKLDESIKMYQEFDNAMNMSRKLKVGYLDFPAFSYELSDNSISVDKQKIKNDCFRFIVDKYYSYVIKELGTWGGWKWNNKLAGTYPKNSLKYIGIRIRSQFYRLLFTIGIK